MKVTIERNKVHCPCINTTINHMECNDECAYFKGCAIIENQFTISCSYSLKQKLTNERTPVCS
ncbi:MAG: hypothetical protein AB1454_09600 [Candidatus Auribacterota bacterium]|jgi:hypothetical protein